MSLAKLTKETAVYGISAIAGRFLYFLLTPLYTYQLENRSDYGIVSNLFAIVALLMIAFTYRMETAYFRYATGVERAEAEKAFQTASISIAISSVGLGVLLWSMAGYIAQLFQYPEYVHLVKLCVLILCLDALCEIPFARLRLEGRAKLYAFIRLAVILINIGGNLFFLLLCPYLLKHQGFASVHGLLHTFYHPEQAITYIFVSNVLASAFALLLLLPVYRRMQWRFDKRLWWQMMVYAAPLILVGFSYVINETFSRQMMPFLLEGSVKARQEQLGIYGANYKLAMLLSLFTQAFRYGAEPFFFKHKNAENARQLYADVALYFTVFMALGFLGVMMYLDLFKYFIAPGYWAGLGVVPILLMANLFLGLYYNLSVWYRVNDLTHWGAYISLAGAAVTMALNIWWIPLIGYYGSAWATLICYSSMAAACYFIGQRFFAVPYNIPRIGLYIVFALGIYALSGYLSPASLVWRLVLNTTLIGVFIAAVYLLEKKKLAAVLR
ncbi:MAG: polysaccharide biosynthesis C-terminal domain-containing protein [Saprospiraceae bacterium]|jgi:O-antigen/teichoic acid export membrane protein|nr:polysaccharide biosynthesis C-terminal domain-containing protein [Saprospiraceae bacterium]